MCVLWDPSPALLRTPFLVCGTTKHTKLIALPSFCLGVVVLHFQPTSRSVKRKLNLYFVIRKLADDRFAWWRVARNFNCWATLPSAVKWSTTRACACVPVLSMYHFTVLRATLWSNYYPDFVFSLLTALFHFFFTFVSKKYILLIFHVLVFYINKSLFYNSREQLGIAGGSD